MLYASDFVDEGPETVLGRARERGGLDALELAAIYHHGRDLYPHNPLHRLLFLDGGACFFRPDPTAFEGHLIQPQLARMLDEIDPVRRLVALADDRGIPARAWTITLHNFTLGERYPAATAENVFGDRSLTDLCPANPDSRAYARAITAELARTGVSTIVAESVCYMPFEHGFHHERQPYPLSDTVLYLLGVCFCAHCRAAALAAGGDPDHARAVLRDQLQLAIAGEPSDLDGIPLDRAAVASIADGAMAGLLDARERVVTSLVAGVTEEVERAAPGCRFVFMDSLGASDAGNQTGPLVADTSWRFGVDLRAVAAACHGISMMGYSRDDERFRADAQAYRDRLGPDQPLSLVLRAMPPDCLAAGELPPKIRVARELDVDWLEFYTYGLMRLSGLDWIRDALGGD
jgi:hypothetical protein